MNKKDAAGPGSITVAQASKLLMITPRRLRQLAADGHIPPAVKGRYPVVGIVRGYTQFLREGIERSTESNAGASLASAREREIRLRLSQREADLIDMSDVEAISKHITDILRTELAPVPDESTDDPGMRAKIRAEIDSIFYRHDKRWQAALAALRAGRDPLDS